MFPRVPGGLPYRKQLSGAPDSEPPPPQPYQARAPIVTLTPRAWQIGSVDFIPNLLITTLAVATVAAPFLPLDFSQYQPKYEVRADQYVNTLVLGYNPQPQVQRLEAYPQPKYQVQCEQPPRPLTLGINPQPATVQLSDSATPPKPPVTVDQPTVHPLTLGYNPQSKVQGLTESAPRGRYPPQVDVYPNLLNTTLAVIAAAGIPPGDQLFDSAPPQKYKVQCDQYINTLVLGYNPQPRVAQLLATEQRKYAVTVDQPPSSATLTAPVLLPPGQQLSASAPAVKHRPQVDQPLNQPLTLGINPQPRAAQLSDSAPRVKFSVQVDQPPNRVALTAPVLPGTGTNQFIAGAVAETLESGGVTGTFGSGNISGSFRAGNS